MQNFTTTQTAKMTGYTRQGILAIIKRDSNFRSKYVHKLSNRYMITKQGVDYLYSNRLNGADKLNNDNQSKNKVNKLSKLLETQVKTISDRNKELQTHNFYLEKRIAKKDDLITDLQNQVNKYHSQLDNKNNQYNQLRIEHEKNKHGWLWKLFH
ncbi:hypothetical protein WR164_13790 [Philodulcilactobacillus myokoensis]|uniref:DUF536 domain-containing protein n=1 Tax=Philodulcilactobacillus myokoensis TaxID=2929573 RepID=A0A9W6B386_9LACO|nr:hypothetical protein [Philodulcilactobacillus myokoensis]GLB47400.1 hypothetical protein WR164_13790 [Philodulcilactobacillus myokoensis]